MRGWSDGTLERTLERTLAPSQDALLIAVHLLTHVPVKQSFSGQDSKKEADVDEKEGNEESNKAGDSSECGGHDGPWFRG